MAARRIEDHLADGPAELFIGEGEVLPRFADEDAGGVNAIGQGGLAVEKGDGEAA